MILHCLTCGKPRRYSPSKRHPRCYRCFNAARTGQPGRPLKLTDALVLMVRTQVASGLESKRGMARKLGVAPSTILDIVERRTWRHVA